MKNELSRPGLSAVADEVPVHAPGTAADLADHRRAAVLVGPRHSLLAQPDAVRAALVPTGEYGSDDRRSVRSERVAGGPAACRGGTRVGASGRCAPSVVRVERG